MLDRHQGRGIRDSLALGKARALPAGLERCFDLGAGTVHQHQPDSEGGEQIDVLDEVREPDAIGDQFPAERHHESAPAKGVQVRGRLAEPADKSFRLRGRGHTRLVVGGGWLAFANITPVHGVTMPWPTGLRNTRVLQFQLCRTSRRSHARSASARMPLRTRAPNRRLPGSNRRRTARSRPPGRQVQRSRCAEPGAPGGLAGSRWPAALHPRGD